MTDHIHGVPEERPDLCPSCKCCVELSAIKEKRRAKDRQRYQRHAEGRRAKARRWWQNRKTRPEGPTP